tara:strand:- start:1701 stop:1985 length:285 start_codon:yes stop_codon:yes gene_type:complete
MGASAGAGGRDVTVVAVSAGGGAAGGGGGAATGGSAKGGGSGEAASGFTIKECLHFGHLMLAPWGGTRESSKLYFALQLGQTIRILTSSNSRSG